MVIDIILWHVSKFSALTVVPPIEKIMKEAITMVPESIYDPKFPDTSQVILFMTTSPHVS